MNNMRDNKQSNITHNTTTPETTLFSKKNELPQVGLKPTTLCSLDECSANWATEAAQMARAWITKTTQYKSKKRRLSITLQYSVHYLYHVSLYIRSLNGMPTMAGVYTTHPAFDLHATNYHPGRAWAILGFLHIAKIQDFHSTITSWTVQTPTLHIAYNIRDNKKATHNTIEGRSWHIKQA